MRASGLRFLTIVVQFELTSKNKMISESIVKKSYFADPSRGVTNGIVNAPAASPSRGQRAVVLVKGANCMITIVFKGLQHRVF